MNDIQLLYIDLFCGAKLMNATDHSKRGQRTDSVGFCFFAEDPDEVIHWLSGCTYPDWQKQARRRK